MMQSMKKKYDKIAWCFTTDFTSTQKQIHNIRSRYKINIIHSIRKLSLFIFWLSTNDFLECNMNDSFVLSKRVPGATHCPKWNARNVIWEMWNLSWKMIDQSRKKNKNKKMENNKRPVNAYWQFDNRTTSSIGWNKNRNITWVKWAFFVFAD